MHLILLKGLFTTIIDDGKKLYQNNTLVRIYQMNFSIKRTHVKIQIADKLLFYHSIHCDFNIAFILCVWGTLRDEHRLPVICGSVVISIQHLRITRTFARDFQKERGLFVRRSTSFN